MDLGWFHSCTDIQNFVEHLIIMIILTMLNMSKINLVNLILNLLSYLRVEMRETISNLNDEIQILSAK